MYMEATVRMTYEIVIEEDMTSEELEEYIEMNVYRALDIGLGHEADEYDLEIEIDEEQSLYTNSSSDRMRRQHDNAEYTKRIDRQRVYNQRRTRQYIPRVGVLRRDENEYDRRIRNERSNIEETV